MLLLNHMLRRFIKTGTLTVTDPNGKKHVFSGAPGPQVAFRITDPAVPRKLFFNPDLALGEGYMDGKIIFEGCTLRDFLHLFNLNRLSLGAYPFQSVLRKISKGFRFLQQHNPVKKSRENVAHHYDLSRELYKLFLDEDMQYSCAYFPTPETTLEQAQRNKKIHIASKLLLKPGQRVLDIGCGWGGMGLFLASLADVEVTGVTLSVEQHEVATERAKAAGLSHRLKFELRDYRDVDQTFDRIVSVGMFEHVGVNHFDEFFNKVKTLLKDDGVMLLHAIGRMSPPGTTGPWIRKYIFPGGYSPSMSEVFAATERARLWVTDTEMLRVHYAETLRCWEERFQANREQVAKIYDERFCRMWEFYLTCCEMAFREGSALVFQMQLGKERAAAPLTRDYMVDTERVLQAMQSTPARRAA